MAEQEPTAEQSKLRTSIATPTQHPDEDTVQFLRFTHVGQTAYQKGQHAGFLRHISDRMVARGSARIVVPAPSRNPAMAQDEKTRKSATR